VQQIINLTYLWAASSVTPAEEEHFWKSDVLLDATLGILGVLSDLGSRTLGVLVFVFFETASTIPVADSSELEQ